MSGSHPKLPSDDLSMPYGLRRFHQAETLHFLTFSCYHRLSYLRPSPKAPQRTPPRTNPSPSQRPAPLDNPAAYVLMPEYAHLLINEPHHGKLMSMEPPSATREPRPPLGLVKIEKEALEQDWKVADGYILYSAELLRLALLAITGIATLAFSSYRNGVD